MIYAGGRAIAAGIAFEDGPSVSDFTLHYLYDDALGSIQTIASESGSIEATRDYAPFGKLRSSGGLQATVPFGFTGHEEDADLGLINMRGRFYDPELGQFMSADPIMTNPEGQGLNRFAYVENSPLNYIDPTGFALQTSTGDTGADSAIAAGVYFGGITAYAFFSSSAGSATINAVGGAVSSGASAVGSAASSAGSAIGGFLSSPAFGPGNVASAVGNVPNAARALSGAPIHSTHSQGLQISRSQVARGAGSTPPAGRAGSNGWAPVQEFEAQLIRQAESTPDPPPLSPAERVREGMAFIAEFLYLTQPPYGQNQALDRVWGPGIPKCNKFSCDVGNFAGARIPTGPNGGTPPQAADFARGKVPGFEVVDANAVQRGDWVAQQRAYNNAIGHMGIVTQPAASGEHIVISARGNVSRDPLSVAFPPQYASPKVYLR